MKAVRSSASAGTETTTLSSSFKSSIVVSSFCALVAGIVIALKYNNYFWNDDENDENNDDQNNGGPRLPPHLQRALYKEKRRKASVRFLAMKSPMYDNIQMYGPDQRLLCTISEKKAHWYVTKNLATWNGTSSENEPSPSTTATTKSTRSITLTFQPKGKSMQPDEYQTSQKHNLCVCCGDTEHYMRHYVVPYSYRQLLPPIYKSHMAHDIVLLCPDCNLTCKQYTQRRQKRLEDVLRIDPETAPSVIRDPQRHTIRSKALSLLNHRDKLPPKVCESYQRLIRSYHELSSEQELTVELLQQTAAMETHRPNPKYIPGAKLVVDHLLGANNNDPSDDGGSNNNEEALEEFIREWRRFFVDTMQPRYLPKGWDIQNPIRCDLRT